MSEQGRLSVAPFWLRSNSRMLVFNLLLKLTMRVPVFPSASVYVNVPVCVFVQKSSPKTTIWQQFVTMPAQLQMINNVCDIVVKSIILSYILGAREWHTLNIKCSTATHTQHTRHTHIWKLIFCHFAVLFPLLPSLFLSLHSPH